MTEAEQKLLATVAWKENRGGGVSGMQSIINVVLNRVKRHKASIESVVLAPWQFTSMSVTSDPEYHLDPSTAALSATDAAAWQEAKQLAQQAASDKLQDITLAATLYYAPAAIQTHRTIKLPTGEVAPWPQKWNQAACKYTATIAHQIFFLEV